MRKVILMKIQFLGTAAAEGMPAIFCNCAVCQEARKLGGKNIRTRSQALVDDQLLIDLPADTYMHFLMNGIEGDRIRNLLITHSHEDHLYPDELDLRRPPFGHDQRVPKLKVYCGEGAYAKIERFNREDRNVAVEKVTHFSSVSFDGYTVTALPARHAPGDGAQFYVIEGEKTILYAHDTGYFYEEVFDFIQQKGFRFDLVSMDCTNVDIPIDDEGTHMGIDNIQRVLKRLEDMGAVNNATVKVINHFSHNGNPLQHVLEARVADLGYVVSYDGMTLEI